MKIEYDPSVDALYIYLHRSEVDRTVEVQDGLNIDLDSEGRIVGIEILDALKQYTPEELFHFDAEQLAIPEPVAG